MMRFTLLLVQAKGKQIVKVEIAKKKSFSKQMAGETAIVNQIDLKSH